MRRDELCPCQRGAALILVLLALSVLLVSSVILFAAIFGGEMMTLLTIERVDPDQDLFTMEYKGDYGLDSFLEKGGAKSDAELVDFVAGHVLHGIPLQFDLPDLGCSTYAAELEDGEPIFGRNFDMYDSPAMLVTTRPKNGYDSISMVNLAYIGYSAEYLPENLSSSILTLAAPYAPLDGVNEKGLAVGVLLIDTQSTHQDAGLPDLTTTSAIRLLLDRAATVQEAVALLKNYDMHASANSCYHFHIADARGDSVVVEYIGDEMSVMDGRAATNFLLTPGEYDFGKGQDRYAILVETLKSAGGVLEDSEAAMALLEAVSQKRAAGKKSTTQWSCVYRQKDACVDVAIDMNYDRIYRFSL